MGDYRFRTTTELAPLRVASGKLFLPNDVGSRIENMNPTEEGTLRFVVPYPFYPTTPLTVTLPRVALCQIYLYQHTVICTGFATLL